MCSAGMEDQESTTRANRLDQYKKVVRDGICEKQLYS